MEAASLPRVRMPHILLLTTCLAFFCAILTYIVPSGGFERTIASVNGHEQSLVIPNSYHGVPKHYSWKGVIVPDHVEGKASPVGIQGFLSAIPRGLEGAAGIIFFLFVIGGTFGILEEAGVFAGAVQALVEYLGGSAVLVTVSVVLALGFGGSTIGLCEEVLPLVPLCLLVSSRLGYDRVFGVALVICGSFVGFAASTTNPFTVNVAQGIAQLPPTVGWGCVLPSSYWLC